jgi:hypothetical protein
MAEVQQSQPKTPRKPRAPKPVLPKDWSSYLRTVSTSNLRPTQSPSGGLHPTLVDDGDNPAEDLFCKVWAPQEIAADGTKTRGRSTVGSCPLTWAWKKGKPALRFCMGEGREGRIIPVTDAIDALAKGSQICKQWYARTGPIPRPPAPNPRYQILAEQMGGELSQYALGRVRRRKRRSR